MVIIIHQNDILMLAYCKMILSKMSIDTQLFKKELKKAYRLLKSDEIIELNRWLIIRYPDLMRNENLILIKN